LPDDVDTPGSLSIQNLWNFLILRHLNKLPVECTEVSYLTCQVN
jgi:hypothetical protein